MDKINLQNSKADNFYITTTLPYVNSSPHLGFALEIVQADVIARYQRLLGKKVLFNFGTDEHGIKIYRKAKESGKTPKDYVDEYAKRFDQLKSALDLSYDLFIRTTDKKHKKAVIAFWERCKKNGDIYKKKYKAKYCVGCELFKTDSELVDGKCPEHLTLNIEIVEEENYFFKFSKYTGALLDLYKKNPSFVVPAYRLNEIKTFAEKGLEDFSISRLRKNLPWGIEVPNDPKHVIYVWFDALTNYISTLGWPDDKKAFKEYWPGVQVAGKDNLRQQAAIWQAMLASADLPFSKQIFIHGFISSGGQRMSKTLGNIVDPFEIVEKYGTDAIRYYLLAKIHPHQDSDWTEEKFKNTYTGELSNGLGNLAQRISGLTGNIQVKLNYSRGKKISPEVSKHLDDWDFNLAIADIWKRVQEADVYINQNKVWEKKGKDKINDITHLIRQLGQIAFDLKPFLPQTSSALEEALKKDLFVINKPLFPKLEG